MSAGIQVITPTTEEGRLPADHDAAFQGLEAMQARINPHLPENADPQPSPMRSLPPEIVEKAAAILDTICAEMGQKPLSERLIDLHARISELAERHFLAKQNKEQERKGEIQGNVKDQTSWKGYQAFAHGAGGGVSFLFTIGGLVASQINSDLGKLIQALARPELANSVTHTATTWIDGHLTPLSHEQQLFQGDLQFERQSTEGLKNALHQLLQLALEVERQESQSYSSIAQQR